MLLLADISRMCHTVPDCPSVVLGSSGGLLYFESGISLIPSPARWTEDQHKLIFLTFPLNHFTASSGHKVCPFSLKSSAVVWEKKLIQIILVINYVRLVSVWQLWVPWALCQCCTFGSLTFLYFSCTFVECTVESSLAITLSYSKDQVKVCSPFSNFHPSKFVGMMEWPFPAVL